MRAHNESFQVRDHSFRKTYQQLIFGSFKFQESDTKIHWSPLALEYAMKEVQKKPRKDWIWMEHAKPWSTLMITTKNSQL